MAEAPAEVVWDWCPGCGGPAPDPWVETWCTVHRPAAVPETIEQARLERLLDRPDVLSHRDTDGVTQRAWCAAIHRGNWATPSEG